MNRRDFLRSLFASSATVVVAPAIAMEMLDRKRTYFDMGRAPDMVVIDVPWHKRVAIPIGDSIVLERIEFTPEERMRTLSTGGWKIAFRSLR